MMAVLVYSILPRLVMLIIQSIKLKQQISAWIKWDWPLMQQSFELKKTKVEVNETVNVIKKEIHTQDYDAVLTWQMPNDVVSNIENKHITALGVKAWEEDQKSIQAINDNALLNNILVLVDARQAPIADVADLIQPLLSVDKNHKKSIVLLINTATNHPLREGQIYSWQNFAKELGVQSYLTDQM